jgi:RND superfamily putative drug exporter
LLWLLAAASLAMLAAQTGGVFRDELALPGSDSQQAAEILAAKFPTAGQSAVRIVFHLPTGTVNAPPAASSIRSALDEVRRQPHVVGVDDPLSPTKALVSADGTIAFATVLFDLPAADLGEPVLDALERAVAPARAAGVQVELGGQLLDYVSPLEGSLGEAVGLLAALAILVLAFRSVVAAGVPIVSALLPLAVGMCLVVLLAARVEVSTAAPTLAAMLGLGVGIDYSLFIVTRFREELARQQNAVAAVGNALATSGRAVLFAGATVIGSILGLWLADLPFAGWLGTAAAITVGVIVLGAVTLLPALLGVLGRRIEGLKVPGLGRSAKVDASPSIGRWGGWAQRVVRRPRPFLFVSTGLLLILAAPAMDLRMGQPDQGSESAATTQRRAYDLIARGFGPGVNGPLLIVVDLPQPGAIAVADDIAEAVAADPSVAAVAPSRPSPGLDAALVTVIPRSAPQAPETKQLVDRLRGELLPAATVGTLAQAHVTGVTATYLDLDARAQDRLPVIVAGVIGLSMALLLLAFRSVVVAITAAFLNLLSIGAAYGVVVAIFQWGWGLAFVGLDQTVPIQSFVPMFMFAVLFGLSMDYEVFLLSRIREEFAGGGDTRRAIVGGIGSTARVITSAALIMIAIFLSFVPVGIPSVKMIGVGLAVAVLIDATIVRLILLPAAMALLGGMNWWIPGWLDRLLPHLALESGSAGRGDGG